MLNIRWQRGVTLIEMMVAMVVGLIVVAAVLSLVTSVMKANRQTIEATRLMQELRATAAVIGADVRRSRGVVDPLAAATQVGGNPFKDISTPEPVELVNGCITYGYEGGAGGNYRLIRLNNQKVVLSTSASALNCGSPPGNGAILTSKGVRITALSFSRLPLDGSGGQPDTDRAKEIRVSITGSLITPDPGLAPISRTITQSIFIPSIGSGS